MVEPLLHLTTGQDPVDQLLAEEFGLREGGEVAGALDERKFLVRCVDGGEVVLGEAGDRQDVAAPWNIKNGISNRVGRRSVE